MKNVGMQSIQLSGFLVLETLRRQHGMSTRRPVYGDLGATLRSTTN